jgi:hypothetical protein
MQTGSTPPSKEQLQDAFHQVPGLTGADAGILGRDAYGVLAKGLDLEPASAMRSALAAQGVQTEVVEDAALTELPPPRQLTKVDFSPEALQIHDLMGRSFPLKWSDISIIAAGRAWLTDFTSDLVRKLMTQAGGGNYADCAPFVRVEKITKEERREHLLLEIITRGAALRYHVMADVPETLLLFQCLGERRCKDLTANLALFVQELATFAPAAILNYGAYNMCDNRDPSFIYASKTAFYREITWLLWMVGTGRMQQ